MFQLLPKPARLLRSYPLKTSSHLITGKSASNLVARTNRVRPAILRATILVKVTMLISIVQIAIGIVSVGDNATLNCQPLGYGDYQPRIKENIPDFVGQLRCVAVVTTDLVALFGYGLLAAIAVVKSSMAGKGVVSSDGWVLCPWSEVRWGGFGS